MKISLIGGVAMDGGFNRFLLSLIVRQLKMIANSVPSTREPSIRNTYQQCPSEQLSRVRSQSFNIISWQLFCTGQADHNHTICHAVKTKIYKNSANSGIDARNNNWKFSGYALLPRESKMLLKKGRITVILRAPSRSLHNDGGFINFAAHHNS